jgi:hypothetical protein
MAVFAIGRTANGDTIAPFAIAPATRRAQRVTRMHDN